MFGTRQLVYTHTHTHTATPSFPCIPRLSFFLDYLLSQAHAFHEVK